jgi:SAM-dependent methyltransferase
VDASGRPDAEFAEWRDLNRSYWDSRVPVHVASRFYDVDGFIAGRDPLVPVEVEEVGEVAGRSLLHLQCHFGVDTLGWARRGATVTGLDFSAPAVEAARRVADDCGIDADFVQADVYDAPAALGGRRFDVVYTGFGALCWLPDIVRWAEVAAALLAPGGFLYVIESNPLIQVMADDDLSFERSYFERGPYRWSDAGTYTDGGEHLPATPTIEWAHGIGDVVSAVARAGLRVDFLHEHPFLPWARWPWLERDGDGTFRFPSDRPALPLTYSLRATRS